MADIVDDTPAHNNKHCFLDVLTHITCHGGFNIIRPSPPTPPTLYFAMTSLLNITGSRVVEDPSFRYKMPRLVCRIEGRGNGIRTCIVNLSDVSSALNRPPDILTKYFGVELGAQSRYEMDVSVPV